MSGFIPFFTIFIPLSVWILPSEFLKNNRSLTKLWISKNNTFQCSLNYLKKGHWSESNKSILRLHAEHFPSLNKKIFQFFFFNSPLYSTITFFSENHNWVWIKLVFLKGWTHYEVSSRNGGQTSIWIPVNTMVVVIKRWSYF